MSRESYDFVREDGQWNSGDVETKCGAEAPVHIAERMREFDYSR